MQESTAGRGAQEGGFKGGVALHIVDDKDDDMLPDDRPYMGVCKIQQQDAHQWTHWITRTWITDFDGDEMNLHLPQTLQTQEELLQLA